MIDPEWFKILGRFVFDRRVRLRVQGYRPEVICLIKATGRKEAYLLTVPEADHTVWTPPQEGIGLDDTIEKAAFRCLEVELGFKESQLQFRRSCWIAKRILPTDRWGERDLPYSLARLKCSHAMIGKAYYAALVVADRDAVICLNPAEVYRYAWLDSIEYLKRIETNLQDKLTIIQTAWRKLIGR